MLEFSEEVLFSKLKNLAQLIGSDESLKTEIFHQFNNLFDNQESEELLNLESFKKMAISCSGNPLIVEELNSLLPQNFSCFVRCGNCVSTVHQFAASNWKNEICRFKDCFSAGEYDAIVLFFSVLEDRFIQRKAFLHFIETFFKVFDCPSRVKIVKDLGTFKDCDDDILIDIVIAVEAFFRNCCLKYCSFISETKNKMGPKHVKTDEAKSSTKVQCPQYDPSVMPRNFEDDQLFFRIKQVCGNDIVYNNFLKCLELYNKRSITDRRELAKLVSPFMRKCPDVWSKFLKMIQVTAFSLSEYMQSENSRKYDINDAESYMEFDFMTAKRFGPSYRYVPKSSGVKSRKRCFDHSSEQVCSGKKLLQEHVKECINDGSWVSYPSWSEDASQQQNKLVKIDNKFSGYLDKIDDDRYEMDIVIDSTVSAISLLEQVQDRILKTNKVNGNRSFGSDEFVLDETFGTGKNCAIEKWAISRIYGTKFADIMTGIRGNPYVAVPVVLRRLQEKNAEWKQMKESLNHVWSHFTILYSKKSNDQKTLAMKLAQVKQSRNKHLRNELDVLEAQTEAKRILGPVSNFCSGLDESEKVHQQIQYPSEKIVQDVISIICIAIDASISTGAAAGFTSEQVSNMKRFMQRSLQTFLLIKPSDELTAPADQKPFSDSSSASLSQNSFKVDKISSQSEVVSNKFPSQSEVSSLRFNFLICNFQWYVLFKLFALICEMIQKSAETFGDVKTEKEKYQSIISICALLLDGSLDSVQFEQTMKKSFSDTWMHLLGLEKVMTNFVKVVFNIFSNTLNLSVLETQLEYHKTIQESNKFLNPKLVTSEEFHIPLPYWTSAMPLFVHGERLFELYFVRVTGNHDRCSNLIVKYWKNLQRDIAKTIVQKCSNEQAAFEYSCVAVPPNMLGIDCTEVSRIFLKRNLTRNFKLQPEKCIMKERAFIALKPGKRLTHVAESSMFFYRGGTRKNCKLKSKFSDCRLIKMN